MFAGRNLDPEDAENHLYFQDAESYLQGIRYGSANGEMPRSKLFLRRTRSTFLSTSTLLKSYRNAR
jgi:hypothetical protein